MNVAFAQTESTRAARGRKMSSVLTARSNSIRRT